MAWFTCKNLHDLQSNKGGKKKRRQQQMFPGRVSSTLFPPESGALLDQHPEPSWLAAISGSRESVFASPQSSLSGIGSSLPGRVFQFLHVASSSLGYLFFHKKCTLPLPALSAEHHYGQIERQRLRGCWGHRFTSHCGSLWIWVQNTHQHCVIPGDNRYSLLAF